MTPKSDLQKYLVNSDSFLSEENQKIVRRVNDRFDRYKSFERFGYYILIAGFIILLAIAAGGLR